MSNERNIFIIVAGGHGTRFGGETPKQFLLLAGKPVLQHTIEAMSRISHSEMIVVLPQEHIKQWQRLVAQHHCSVAHRVVAGGDCRWQSVNNALATLRDVSPQDVIAVHDGVRPLVSEALLRRVVSTARGKGSAVPVTPLTDSIRLMKADGSSQAMSREAFRAVQTPQAFKGTVLMQAYAQAGSRDFTDDASVVEHMGIPVIVVDGETTNIKITRPADLILATQLLQS
ncbi:MAG: 2-C-methyl-D-erythritol 4-phosphate cytidylyltransferase [Muribaculaceae bacterium]|nr:2-C-methyl-D-erythritol 4-phosphate cytidylyltransferase [Muribaculaceae bacterium]